MLYEYPSTNLAGRLFFPFSGDPMQRDQSDDEEDAFVRKVETFKHVTVDLTEILREQKDGLSKLEPMVSGNIARLRSNIMQLTKLDSRQFYSWTFYFLTSLFFLFLLFILNLIL